MSTSSTGSNSIPKAVLYWNPTSVWSTVPLLALREKGYSEEDFNMVTVDISRGDNFSLDYLRLNPHGTIPTLVVPVWDGSAAEAGKETRYKSIQDTISILTFLDSSRTPHSTPSSSSPAPALSPATIEGKHLSDTLILAVHLPTADPNFLLLCARSPHELMMKEKGFAGHWIKARQEALHRYIKESEEGSSTHLFLKNKLQANQIVYDVYYSPHTGPETEARRQAFFAASRKAWGVGVVENLDIIESNIVGPYTLGDQISLADLHIIAWLARIVFLSQGGPTPAGLEALEKQIAGTRIGLGLSGGAATASGGTIGTPAMRGPQNPDAPLASLKNVSSGDFKIGQKTKMFWAAWIERDSFKRIYSNSTLH
ncbi:Thioredoxin-like fold [Phaffia rhodozyma]|uniref:Thioredoxin-like fold n=1 Tax=Phaffia rhodozyma TaxID=264483 RepID=A0A0F7STX0_PHARH|nr:Thioredoxin-like fold [Phaffia rhodozyma]